MGFFDRLPAVQEPEPEPPRMPRPVWMKPETALGAVVSEELLLARTPDAALAITGLLAYPTGFEFTLSAVLRREDRHGRIFHFQHGPGRYRDEPLPDEFIRLGVQFGDGRIATNLGQHPVPSPRFEPTGPVLVPVGGSGGGRRYDMHYWIWPLPPAGPVTFVCQWPVFSIPESRAEVGAELVLDAAGRAVEIWPEDDESSG